MVFATSFGTANLANPGCRQALAFGRDVSASVDPREYAVQREGLANARLSPPVIEAFETMPAPPVALMSSNGAGIAAKLWSCLGL